MSNYLWVIQIDPTRHRIGRRADDYRDAICVCAIQNRLQPLQVVDPLLWLPLLPDRLGDSNNRKPGFLHQTEILVGASGYLNAVFIDHSSLVVLVVIGGTIENAVEAGHNPSLEGFTSLATRKSAVCPV